MSAVSQTSERPALSYVGTSRLTQVTEASPEYASPSTYCRWDDTRGERRRFLNVTLFSGEIMHSADAAKTLVGQEDLLCILVVEDEVLIRWMVAEILRDAGYAVIEAMNGDEALEIIQSGVRVDLVFSDVRMPGKIDGTTLLEIVRKQRPDLPVVITSGHCDPTAALSGGAVDFVRKPYDPDRVVTAVATHLKMS